MNKDTLNALLAGLLTLAIGILSGYSLGYYRGVQSRFPEIQTVADINPGIATLRLNGYSNGKLKGEVAGREIRIIAAQDNIQTVTPGTAFEAPVTQTTINLPAIPADARFAASRQGKLYYSIFDPRVLELSPANRIYFRSSEEAEKGGYKKAGSLP